MFKQTFNDFDEYAYEVSHWELGLQQMDAGRFRSQLMQAVIGDVLVGHAHYNCGRIIKQQGATPNGLWTVLIPASDAFTFNWRGIQVDGNCLMIFPPGSEWEGVSRENFHIYTYSFPDSLLDQTAYTLGSNLRQPDQRLVRCSPMQMAAIRQHLRQLCIFLCDESNVHDRKYYAEIAQLELPQLLFQSMSQNDYDFKASQTGTSRKRVLRIAEDYIEHKLEHDLTVTEVCEEAQASVRTLQLAFTERYGISPKAYIRAIRLNRVRKWLRTANPSSTVIADVANANGFWHMGQFAADYRRLFGELPTATLKRKS